MMHASSMTYIKQGLSFEFVKPGVEEAQSRKTLQQTLIINQRQHPSNYRG